MRFLFHLLIWAVNSIDRVIIVMLDLMLVYYEKIKKGGLILNFV